MPEIINISYVDDVEFYLDAIKVLLEQKHVDFKDKTYCFKVKQYSDAKAFMHDINQAPNIIMLDILFKGDREIGHTLANYSKQQFPEAVIIMYSQLSDENIIKEYISLGVNYFIAKNTPVQNFSLSLLQCYYAYKQDITVKELKNNKHFKEIEAKIKKIIKSDIIDIFHVYGEPGTGKEQIIDVFKKNVKKVKFIRFNCALVESESMLGKLRDSLIASQGGWLLIDEIDSMNIEAQALLLRYIDTAKLDSNGTKVIKTKIVTVTNKNLKKYVEDNLFNNDLLQRISIFSIYVPPLRERNDELSQIIESIIEDITHSDKRYRITSEALQIFHKYDWRLGNIRELKNCILSMLENCENNLLDESIIPKYIRNSLNDEKNSSLNEVTLNIDLNKESYREIEDNLFVLFIKKIIRENKVKSLRGVVPYTDFKRSTLINRVDKLPPEKKKQIRDLLKIKIK
ncbi:MAG: sigma 54-interacting transcriptional regulator [Proteobacteria bacterium]|nr:sigma 54-interacting transcriptional regulator [Pseudomonadota bacterium]